MHFLSAVGLGLRKGNVTWIPYKGRDIVVIFTVFSHQKVNNSAIFVVMWKEKEVTVVLILVNRLMSIWVM